ncbi:hypothetical protein [Sinorhizobium medicae]|uniref:hypothetical protein n=1 Tax=Sinorhizobium medicae TaxID=110321 RepID=UPI000FD9FEAF|nr:hypothetical protein [Sinorhizobium medicae]RVP47332.1 hypothetical protein CN078_26805 [Sinorhizobium medicae]RVP75435.1 hypothetical protein CN079_20060 [Sinorhizobium medicae]UWU06591.1 hypothetical protein N2598_09355 [Sinorhizobium medicae]
MHAAVNIERFPEWNFRPQRTQRAVIDWVAIENEYDIGDVILLWERVVRFHIDQLPDDESVPARVGVDDKLSVFLEVQIQLVSEISRIIPIF